MSRDLLEPEQRNVRTALRYLRVRTGGWITVAAALHCKPDTLGKIVSGRALPAQLCPHCGRPTDDFADEQTVVEDRPREISRKLGGRNEF